MQSLKELYKIGNGPSSSHTMGPKRAVEIFKNKNLEKRVDVENINLDDVTIDDLKFNGDNYNQHINLLSLLVCTFLTLSSE